MLSREKAEIAAETINIECRAKVLPFVMMKADLPPDLFETEAEAYLQGVERRIRNRLGEEFDDLDALMMEGYRRAMLFEYKRLRMAGANQVGRA